MSTGTISKLVHLSEQTEMPNAQLVRDHNPCGYGYIHGAEAEDVYFDYDDLEGTRFNELSEGDRVEYGLDSSAIARAARVSRVND